MPNTIFDISFTDNGQTCIGWVHPPGKTNEEGMPASFYVVLNTISFGYLSFQNGSRTIDEDRPENLVKKAGKEIEKHFAF